MIKHMYKHQIKYEGKLYKPNGQGELYLPIRLEWCNPVEPAIKLKKKKEVVTDEQD